MVDGVGQSSQSAGGNRYKNYLCHFCEKRGRMTRDCVEMEKAGNFKRDPLVARAVGSGQ